MQDSNICLIYNFAQHYRLGIFKLLNDKLGVDFYFGDKMGDVRKLDYSELSNFKSELRNRKILGPIYWQSGALRVLFKPYKHYIILGEYFCLSTWMIALLAPIFGKKIYFWTHGWYGKERGMMKLFKKIFFNLAQDIFLYGDRAKELMVKEGFKKDNLHVIYNSLNYEEQIAIRKELSPSQIYQDLFANSFPVLFFIGRLTTVKKLSWAIEAISILKSKNLNVNFCIIGEGEEKEKLIQLAHSLNLDENIKFIGGLYEEKLIAEYIYNADICISPGNVGLTAMHSLVFGTPVITNNNFTMQMPEFEAIVEGETGGFFIDGNVSDLARTIERWMLKDIGRDKIRNSCFAQIDRYFNPNYQLKIIENVIKANS